MLTFVDAVDLITLNLTLTSNILGVWGGVEGF